MQNPCKMTSNFDYRHPEFLYFNYIWIGFNEEKEKTVDFGWIHKWWLLGSWFFWINCVNWTSLKIPSNCTTKHFSNLFNSRIQRLSDFLILDDYESEFLTLIWINYAGHDISPIRCCSRSCALITITWISKTYNLIW